MADKIELTESERNEAKAAFGTLCKTLDAMGWHYKTDETEMEVNLSVTGDDLSMPLRIYIDPKRQRIVLYSPMDFKMPEERRTDGAVVVCMANYELADGCFDYNIDNGAILFRTTNSYRESIIGEGLVNRMINMATHVVDEYNDRFLMISKGMMTVEQFKAAL